MSMFAGSVCPDSIIAWGHFEHFEIAFVYIHTHSNKERKYFQWVWICVWECVCVWWGGLISFCCLSLLLRSHLELRLSFLCVSWHFFPPRCPSDSHHLFSISVSLSLFLPLTVFSPSPSFDPVLSSRLVTENSDLVVGNCLVVSLLAVFTAWKLPELVWDVDACFL